MDYLPELPQLHHRSTIMALSQSDYLYATVCYADIFEYPLTDDDLYFRSIKVVPKRNVRSKTITGVVKSHYLRYLKGRESIVKIFNKRKEVSKIKWQIARVIANKLRVIPTIYLVGVTGGLSVNNASHSDDIDFFFITAKGTVWISRLLVTLIVGIFGKRRKPYHTDVRDSICLNMFISDDALCIPENEQDLFSAHEVLQMEPLWSRRDTYKRFILENSWTKNFLPVAWNIKKTGRNQHPKISHWWTRVARMFLKMLEIPAKYGQLWYMARRRTTEIVTDSVLRFHPNDARIWIRKALTKRLKKHNIPLDNIFYCR